MNKILIVAATAGLMTLAACTPTANNTADTNEVVANADVYTETANVTVDENAVAPAETNAVDANAAAPEGNAM